MASVSLDLGLWHVLVPEVQSFDLASLGGRKPEPAWLRHLVKANEIGHIWAADSGLEALTAADLWPHYLIGDFDSLTQAQLKDEAINRGARVETFLAKKDLTDFQLLLLSWAKTKPRADRLIVTGFWGGRFDHAWCNLRSCVWALAHHWPAPIVCDGVELLLVLEGPCEVLVDYDVPPHAVSLLPLTQEVCGVQTEGLYWKPDETLSANLPYAVSNKTTGRPMKVSLSSGRLGLYFTAQDLLDSI